jgi:hypothetical protein
MSVNKSIQGVVLYDANGNEMAVEAGEVAVAAVRGLLTQGVDEVNKAQRISAVADGDLWRLTVDARLQGANPLSTRVDYCRDTGDNFDLRVNGTSPKVFTFDADDTIDLQLEEIVFAMSALKFNYNGSSFAQSSALPNGIKVELIVNDGITKEDMLVKINEDWVRLTDFDTWQGGLTDLVRARRTFGGPVLLKGGTGDQVKVTIQDNITSPALALHYLTCTVRTLEL